MDMVFGNFENPIPEIYNKFWLLNIYVACITLTLKLTSNVNFIDFGAVALYREHQLRRADHLNG